MRPRLLCLCAVLHSISKRVHISNSLGFRGLRFRVIVIVMKVLGEYTIVGYLDPKGFVRSIRTS